MNNTQDTTAQPTPSGPTVHYKQLERERDYWKRIAEGRHELLTASETKAGAMEEAHKRSLESDSPVASCGCLTKSPEVKYHKPGCKYRLIMERDESRENLQRLVRLYEKQYDDANEHRPDWLTNALIPPAPSVASESPFEQLIVEYRQWVLDTFPGERVADQAEHLREEFKELMDDPSDPKEYADVLMLLLCVAYGHGVDVIKAFREKFAINKARKWEKTEKGWRHMKGSVASEKVGKGFGCDFCGHTGNIFVGSGYIPCGYCRPSIPSSRPTLLPFDLAKALAGAKVVTRISDVVHDLEQDGEQICGFIGDSQVRSYWNKNGSFLGGEHGPLDLFLAPTP